MNQPTNRRAVPTDVLGFLDQRRLAAEAPFVMPFLNSGSSVLDVGCGSGSLTQDLAMLAAPGKVIGVDMDQASLRAAETRAATSGAYNLRFQLAAAESLPSADEAFDLCFAHTLLEHVTEPGRALREMQRVVRKAGVIALRTPDWRQAQLRPADPEFDRALTAFLRAHYPGSDPGADGRQAGLVRDLGCEIVHEATVLVPQVGRDFARFAAERLRDKGDRSAAAVFDRWQLAEPVFEQAYCEIVART